MYISNDIAERIKEVAKQRKVSVKQLLSDIGLGFNTMSNMKVSMPKADNLARIADYLDCSVDYLLGRTTVKNTNDPETQKYRLLNADGKEKVDMYIDDLLDNPKYQADAEKTKEALIEIKIAARPKHGTEQPESIFIEKEQEAPELIQEDPRFLDD